MKRSMIFTVGALAIATACYFGTRTAAQPTTKPAGTGGTRVGILNMRWCVKNYDKYQAFLKTMKAKETEYVSKLKDKQTQIEQLAKAVEGATGTAKDTKEQEFKNAQRDMEDYKLLVRKQVSQQMNDEMVKVYQEVRDAASRHASQAGFDLVLHFNGALDNTERDSPMMISQNINAGACMPMFWNQTLDISGYVVAALNKKYTPK